MRPKSEIAKTPSGRIVKDIRRAARKHHSAEEKIRIVLDGLRGEYSIAELCRREGIAESLYYSWSEEFLEAGKRRLAGDTARAATSGEEKDLRHEVRGMKILVADLALQAAGIDTAKVVHRPRLLSDNGSSYIAVILAEWLKGKGMDHVRGASLHPQTQGRIERWHQTIKNRILLENYYLPGDLELKIGDFVAYYNRLRYHEGIPRDREGTFDPKLIAKYQRRFPGFDDKIVSMYARGLTIREIRGQLLEIYSIEVSPDLIGTITDAVLEEVAEWQSRPPDPVYAIVFFDALRVKVRDEGTARNKAIYLS